MKHSTLNTNTKPYLFFLVNGASRYPFYSLHELIKNKGINWLAVNLKQGNQRKLSFHCPGRGDWNYLGNTSVYDFCIRGGNRLGDWTVETRKGKEIPFEYLFSLISLKPKRYSCGRPGRKRKHCNYYRNMKTHAERRAQCGFRVDQQDFDNYEGYDYSSSYVALTHRIKGRRRKLSNNWDDIPVRARHNRNWKQFRTTRWRRVSSINIGDDYADWFATDRKRRAQEWYDKYIARYENPRAVSGFH